MRTLGAIIWAIVVFVIVLIVANPSATIGFPPHSTSGNIMRIAGVIIAIGLAISAYRKTAKPPSPPAP
jgi:hypothetical protein